jgi:hypothetical protein
VNEPEHEQFELELRRLHPARLPEDFAERLAAACPETAPRPLVLTTRASQPAPAWGWLRWLAPATAAAAALVALVLWLNALGRPVPDSPARAVAPPEVCADDVEIDRQLVGAFEAVATLPDGEPVRIRCREWMDEVVLRDTVRGVAIQRRTPRLEVIPVSLETF